MVPSDKHMYVLQKKQNCFSVTGINLWNCIENYIKNSKTEQPHKTKFKCFLISSYLDTVENANKSKIEEITVYLRLAAVNLALYHFMAFPYECIYIWCAHVY